MNELFKRILMAPEGEGGNGGGAPPPADKGADEAAKAAEAKAAADAAAAEAAKKAKEKEGAPPPAEKKDDKKPDGDKGKEKDKEVDYSGLKLGKDSLMSDEDLKEIVAFSKERKLPLEVAKTLLEREEGRATKALKTFEESNKPGGAAWNKRVEGWNAEALASPKIGNGSKEKLAEAVAYGKGFMEKYFPPEIAKFLVESGLGSHPKVIEGFAAAGRAAAPDKYVKPGVSTPKAERPTTAHVLYGKTTKPVGAE